MYILTYFVNDVGSHRVHTFIVSSICFMFAWRWLFTAEICRQKS